MDETQVVVLGFSRGYGQTMAEALLAAGSPHSLKPGGELIFTRLLGAQGPETGVRPDRGTF